MKSWQDVDLGFRHQLSQTDQVTFDSNTGGNHYAPTLDDCQYFNFIDIDSNNSEKSWIGNPDIDELGPGSQPLGSVKDETSETRRLVTDGRSLQDDQLNNDSMSGMEGLLSDEAVDGKCTKYENYNIDSSRELSYINRPKDSMSPINYEPRSSFGAISLAQMANDLALRKANMTKPAVLRQSLTRDNLLNSSPRNEIYPYGFGGMKASQSPGKENIIDPKLIFTGEDTKQLPECPQLKRGRSMRSSSRLEEVTPIVFTKNYVKKTKHVATPTDKICRNLTRDLPLANLLEKQSLHTLKSSSTSEAKAIERDEQTISCSKRIDNQFSKSESISMSRSVENESASESDSEVECFEENSPRVSQKLRYLHSLSKCTGTKVNETVAYLHYRLRNYENMAVSTRIRSVLNNQQLNLVRIYNQLGIPEVLVPKRTN
ncbi:Piso0_003066 [Millerozyma farinosa CBS 7064]|uniref:Piso0_003066 protein n=1 Tax=Pichia sorbitophila (strain ATCC MYA-4447 / BCRC 22081 / CBS 7064 / NBRC 10061 / NRRL Y-12695) TaxID=559304 RepID=G8YK93_PICSO|nr:Piso0_003066 [Millerozyma farinosa CBS 7064]CCE80738.1 Piso0_003066 [Millerozyma farinosa CBS 7064]